jgi:hypothetical protein
MGIDRGCPGGDGFQVGLPVRGRFLQALVQQIE